jgi:hypothetical protein
MRRKTVENIRMLFFSGIPQSSARGLGSACDQFVELKSLALAVDERLV